MHLWIDEVEDRLFILVMSTCFQYVFAIEAIEKFFLHLLPIIHGTRLKVCVPIEGIALQGADKLFDEVIVICSNIVQFSMKCATFFFGLTLQSNC